MRHDKIVPGTILVLLGVVFLLDTTNIIDVHWWNIFHLWPIFLLIAGINLIFANNRSVWASALKVGVVIAGFAVLLFANLGDRYNFWPSVFYSNHGNHHRDDDDDDDRDTTGGRRIMKIEGNSTFSEPFHADARYAKLSLSGGATNYNLSDTTGQLFQGATQEFNGRYQFTTQKKDSVYVLNFDMKEGTHKFDFGRHHENTAVFKLNSAPIWDMDITTGASALNFDLSKFKIRNLEINGGAADYTIKMGEPLAMTTLDISIGAADVRVSVPKDAACRIDTDSGLAENHFEGFNKIDDDHYETPGYANAKNKLHIKFDGGAAGYKVTRY